MLIEEKEIIKLGNILVDVIKLNNGN